MLDAVIALYDRNRQRGFAEWCNREYDFVCPSMGTYPFQWFWDSCFHTVVLSHFDLARARAEVESLLANQADDGFVAHVTFWQRDRYEALLSTYSIAYRTPHLSDCMQPPLLAEAVAAIWDKGGDRNFLRAILPKVRAYYDWCDRVRDPDRDGLIAVLQADETGLDMAPKFDGYLGIQDGRAAMLDDFTAGWERVAKPYAEVGRDPARMFALDVFVVEDVMVNTIYAHNQSVLAELFSEIGDLETAREFSDRAAKTRRALFEKCWDEEAGLFFDLGGLAETPLKVNSFTSLFPLVLPDLPSDRAARLIAQLEDPALYAAPYPVPTVPLSSECFDPGREGSKLVWRGPAWMSSNWYLARGLSTHGRPELARHITDRSRAMVERSGFREFYNPHTGEGYGARDFSWTALILDLLEQ
jgi:glycogen debranching enzyme